MSEAQVAYEIFAENKEDDFLFEHLGALYRAQVLEYGKIVTKEICTGVPRLLSAKNVTDHHHSSWRYIFEVRSVNHGVVELTLAASELYTLGAFKRSVLSQIPVVFIGCKGDFEFFIRTEMNRLVKSMPRGSIECGC